MYNASTACWNEVRMRSADLLTRPPTWDIAYVSRSIPPLFGKYSSRDGLTAWELAYYDNICGLWLPPVHLQKPHTWQQTEVRCTTHHPSMAEHAQTATIEARESEPSQPRARTSGRAMSHPHTLRHRDTSSYLSELNSTETNRWSWHAWEIQGTIHILIQIRPLQ